MFYRLECPDPLPQREIACVGDEVRWEPIFCPVHPGHRRAGKRLTPLSVVVTRPPSSHFLWTWLSDLLCTDATLALLTANDVTGFATAPAVVRQSKRRNPTANLPVLHEIITLGWGAFSPEAGVRLSYHCPACGHRRFSIERPDLLVETCSWDGSDIFMVWPLPRYRFVSERFAALIRDLGLSGGDLQPASSIATRPGEPLSCGRLSHWMPEDRARQLGEPLGIY